MLGEFRPHVAALAAQLNEDAFKIDGVPKDNGCDQKVEARGAIGLALETPVVSRISPNRKRKPTPVIRTPAPMRCRRKQRLMLSGYDSGR